MTIKPSFAFNDTPMW